MKNIVILAYHRINDSGAGVLDVPPENFKRQLECLLAGGYTVESAEDIAGRILRNRYPEKKTAAITFDDGHKDNFSNAYPVLKKMGLPATIFLTTSFMDTENFLSWDEAREMSGGGISFGGHTVTHPRLTRIRPEEAKEEILRSRQEIESRLGKPCSCFCYPYGDVNEAVKQLVRECKYSSAVVTPPRRGIGEDILCLKRIGIYRHTDMLQFRLKLWGVYSWLKGR
ncbi:hypothetical protein AUJ67_09240 [Candidatus Desantisbacteria bacterium CG1_02_49_89]|nr:MAG: hypothetical protein AUJ67_09240 [Candidatus Desantisbacteria bacterium CG1_02_49_89]